MTDPSRPDFDPTLVRPIDRAELPWSAAPTSTAPDPMTVIAAAHDLGVAVDAVIVELSTPADGASVTLAVEKLQAAKQRFDHAVLAPI